MSTPTAQHVPTNGFSGIPGPSGQPAGPALPGDQSLPPGVPPAGPPALPRAPSEPAQFAGHTPGWVQNPGQGQQPPALPQAPAAAPAAPGALPADLAGMLQAALASVNGQPAPGAAPAPLTERPAWAPDGVAKFDVSGIEDPIIKSMAGILQTVGKDLDLDRVLGRALASGDATLIDHAYLQEKGGANGQQIYEIAKGIVQAVNEKSAAIEREVHNIAGGQAQWEQATAIFNNAAPAEFKVLVKTLLDSTNPAYIKAGAKLVSDFGRNSGQLPQIGSGLLTGQAGNPATAGGLDKYQFQTELVKLNPNDRNYLAAREDLFKRRALGRAAGL